MRRSVMLRKYLDEENAKWPEGLAPVPREKWPEPPPGWKIPSQVLRSRKFLVQIFAEAGGVVRLTVNRTEVVAFEGAHPIFRDGITWDDLQALKAEAGYRDQWAVEVYPAAAHLVNVAFMRHLWVLPEAPKFAWRAKQKGPPA